MAEIVPMTAEVFDAMDRIDVEAWSDWASKRFGKALDFPSKRRVYGTYLDGDPEGAFVAVDDAGEPVGYVFTRIWGRIGFFGPFGVVPRHQGSHVGKRLVQASVAYMERSGCRVIGLETMPETAYNLGLYAKLGFRLFTLTLRLKKELPSGDTGLPPHVRAVSEPDEALLEAVRRIGGTLEEGLDQSKEIALLRKHPIGSCLAYEKGGEVSGYALCYAFPETVGLYPPCDPENLRIRLLGMDAERCGPAELRDLLEACERHARALGRKTVTVPHYAEYDPTLHELLRLGYRIDDGFPSLVKLAKGDYHVPHPEAASLCEWAG